MFLKNVSFSEQSLVPCAGIRERNLLADTAKIVEKNKICKRKDDFCRKLVTDGLLSLGYDASVCQSRWEKSSSYPAGNSLSWSVWLQRKTEKVQVPLFLVLKKTNGFFFDPDKKLYQTNLGLLLSSHREFIGLSFHFCSSVFGKPNGEWIE